MKVFVIRNPKQSWMAGSSQSILPKLSNSFNWGNITVTSNGKPLIEEGFCSISHSGQLLVVVWDTQNIGFDIERERTIHPELIDRLHLDPSSPMRDWCIREAWIKLDDDPQHLTEAPDPNLFSLEIPIQVGFMAMAISYHPMILESIVELDLDRL